MKKITVVTGQARSRTSLTMQTLKILGDNIVWEEKKRNSEKEKLANNLNPKGFYEIPGVSIRGIKDDKIAESFYGKTIKIVTSGLIKTDPKHIDRIIVCLRDPREVLKSTKKLSSTIKVSDGNKFDYAPTHLKPNFNGYCVSMCRLIKWIRKNPGIHTLLLNTNLYYIAPKDIIAKLLSFLNLEIDGDRIGDAIKNISPELYRSEPIKDEGFKYFDFSIELYNALMSNSVSMQLERKSNQFLLDNRLENSKWFDDTEFKTMMMVPPSLYRSLAKNNNSVRDRLQFNANKRRKNLWPENCKHYDIADSVYTIERPYDIGRITRSFILCANKNEYVTREKCFKCWNKKKREVS